jgi:hypothetical protein
VYSLIGKNQADLVVTPADFGPGSRLGNRRAVEKEEGRERGNSRPLRSPRSRRRGAERRERRRGKRISHPLEDSLEGTEFTERERRKHPSFLR